MKELKIRPLTEEERKYTYTQSTQLDGQTGNIGFLYGEFDSSGKDFYTIWMDRWEKYKTDGFEAELDGVVNALRSGEQGLLQSRTAMKEYVREHPESIFGAGDIAVVGFRVDMGEHAFLIRCNMTPEKDNFFCYCYVSEFLDKHMANARQGIRFIDSHYKELFRIPDGGKIVITEPGGEQRERTCRFVEEYHTEVGSRLYHICEFAGIMERKFLWAGTGKGHGKETTGKSQVKSKPVAESLTEKKGGKF